MDTIEGQAIALREVVQTANSVLLTGPIGPDGDSIGACLALALGIAHICDTPVTVAGRVAHRYASLPGVSSMVPDERIQPGFDVVLVLDGDRHRLEPQVEQAYAAAQLRGIIDHHGSTTTEGYDLAILDAHSPSTCQMVYDLLRCWDVPLNSDLASLIYTGLIFDTGGFRHANTNSGVHHLAATLLDTGFDHSSLSLQVLAERTPAALALLSRVIASSWTTHDGRVQYGIVRQIDLDELQAESSDVEGIVEVLLNTTGVECAILLVERAATLVKLSLRSRSTSSLNVARFATECSAKGGGHARAAGAMLNVDLEQAKSKVETLMRAWL